MQLPLNDIHFFIGFPVLMVLAIDTFLKYRKSGNVTTLYIAMASLFLALSQFCWGFPSLFTKDPQILSYFSFIGDSIQSLMFVMTWLIVVRGYVIKKRTRIVSYIAITLITLLGIFEAFRVNLFPPYPTYIESLSANSYDIVFTSTTIYSTLTAINSISFLLIAVYFWRSANKSTSKSQKFRIKSLATAFLIASILYISLPLLTFDVGFDIEDVGTSIIFSIVGISGIAGFTANYLKRKRLNSPSYRPVR